MDAMEEMEGLVPLEEANLHPLGMLTGGDGEEHHHDEEHHMDDAGLGGMAHLSRQRPRKKSTQPQQQAPVQHARKAQVAEENQPANRSRRANAGNRLSELLKEQNKSIQVRAREHRGTSERHRGAAGSAMHAAWDSMEMCTCTNP